MKGHPGPAQPPKAGMQGGTQPPAAGAPLLLLSSLSHPQEPGRTQGTNTKKPFPILLKREQATSAPLRAQQPPPVRPQQLLREKQALLELMRE